MLPDFKWIANFLPSIIILTVATLLTEVESQSTLNGRCKHNEIIIEDTIRNSHCPREYLRCDRNFWRRCMCVGGVIQRDTGECIPFNSTCPEPRTMRPSLVRKKRQAPSNTALDCSNYYICPSVMTSVFIYPDWSNLNCDSYIVCAAGQLFLTSCLESNYRYYNPRTLSCEDYPSATNTCIFRQISDLSPIYPSTNK